jgi:hypothetical protein
MSAVRDSDTKRVKVFVRLLNEGTEVSRPTEAISLGNGLFRIVSPSNYNPEDEVWEFPPRNDCAMRDAARRNGRVSARHETLT